MTKYRHEYGAADFPPRHRHISFFAIFSVLGLHCFLSSGGFPDAVAKEVERHRVA